MSTSVVVTEQPSGRGTVAVSVTFDRSALTAVGGLAALRRQLDTGGLAAEGWTVAGPSGSAGGGATVTATHGFADPAQLSSLSGEIAGPGVFELTLSTHRTFWHSDYRVGGEVDLTCGIDCFGDSGLAKATGSRVGVGSGGAGSAGSAAGSGGVAAGSAGSAAGSAAAAGLARTFTFRVAVALPGRSAGSPAEWTVALGRSVAVSSAAQTLEVGDVVEVIVAGAVVLFLVGAVGWRVRRRRRPG